MSSFKSIHMKYYLVLFSSIIISLSYGQSWEYIQDKEGFREIFSHGVEFESGKLLTVSFESLLVDSTNSYQISHLRIFDVLNGKLISEKSYKIDSLSTVLSLIYYSETNNRFIIIGEAHTIELNNRRGYFLSTVWDENLNFISDTIIRLEPFNQNNVLWCLSSDIHNKDEFVTIGYYNDNPENLLSHLKFFLAKITTDGKIAKTKWYPMFDQNDQEHSLNVPHPSIFYDKEIDSYVLLGSMVYYLDDSFKIIKSIFSRDFDEYESGVLGLSFLFNDKYLATCRYNDGYNFGVGFFNREVEYEKGINLSDQTESFIQDFSFARQNLDWIDTSAIFIAQHDILKFYFTVAKVNSDLEPYWIKYFGKNDTITNFGWSVIATSDGGCVLAGGIAENSWPGSITNLLTGWLLKLDSEGNHVSTTDTPNSNWEITVFPNPSSGDFRIDLTGVSGESELRLYDLQGREIRKYDHLNEGENDFDFSYLSSGMYIWKLMCKGEEIGNGKWVKR